MKGWRTLIFGIIVAVAGVLEQFDWSSILPKTSPWYNYETLAIGLMIVVLRFFTTTPIFKEK